jgi:hypothetical protein
MPWHLFFVALGCDSALFRIPGQAPKAVTLQNVIHGCRRNLDPMVAIQIPGNRYMPQMVSLAKMEDLFFDF